MTARRGYDRAEQFIACLLQPAATRYNANENEAFILAFYIWVWYKNNTS